MPMLLPPLAYLLRTQAADLEVHTHTVQVLPAGGVQLPAGGLGTQKNLGDSRQHMLACMRQEGIGGCQLTLNIVHGLWWLCDPHPSNHQELPSATS